MSTGHGQVTGESVTQPAAAELQAGQRVWIYDVNVRRGAGPTAGTVTKVGRKLVTVEAGYYTKTFRIEDGRANDNYGHSWIKTEAQRAADDHRRELLARLTEAGVRFEWDCTLPTPLLERFAAALDD